jgi:ATP:ADP antiporter, AAA family
VSWRDDVRAEESRAVVLAGTAFFCILTSYYMIRPVRDQLSGAVGALSLPLFYAATFVATLLMTPLFGALVTRFPRRRLMVWSYSFFIACLVAFVPAFMHQDAIGARLLGTVFFVWVSVFNLFVVSLFWSFMADIWASAQARRLFAYVALGGTAGALAGPILTSTLVERIGVAPLLLVSALLLAMALGVVLMLSAHVGMDTDEQRRGDEVIGGSLWAGLKQVLSQSFLRKMALLMLLSDGIGTLAYALMADYTRAHFPDNAARTQFYGHLDLATNLLSALMQLLVTRWVLVRKGPTWGLVIPSLVNVVLMLAVFVFGSDAPVFGLGAVPLLALMMVVTRGLAYGMHKPSSDALYTRAAREARYKGKNFVETAVWRFGDLVITSALDLMRSLGIAVSAAALVASGLSGVAAWIGGRVGHSPELEPEREERLANAPQTG